MYLRNLSIKQNSVSLTFHLSVSFEFYDTTNAQEFMKKIKLK